MKLKNTFILLFMFLMIISLFTTFNSLQSTNQSSANKTSSISGCPLYVNQGQVIVPIDLINISAVYKYASYDFNLAWDAQPGIVNYYAGYYDNNKGLIYNLTLPDQTQVVAVGFNYKNNTMQVVSDFCFSTCTSPINVFGGQVNGTFQFTSIIGVYIQSDYDYTLPADAQTVPNYYNGSSSYANGIITGIYVPDGTTLVVVGKDGSGNVYFMDNWCQQNNPQPVMGVNPGDVLVYTMKHNATQAIPFFDFNTTYVNSGDNITIKVVSTQPFKVEFLIGSNPSFSADHAMFFITSPDFINMSIANDPNTPQNFGNLTYYDTNTASFTMNDSHGMANFTFDRMQGYLIKMQGLFFDPNGNGIQMEVYLLNYMPANAPNPNPNPIPTTNPYGVNVGDSFQYMFTTNATGAIPLFGLDNGNFKISSGDYLKVRVESIQETQYGPEAIISLSTSNNQVFKTNDTMFFLMPLDSFDMLIKGVNVSADAPIVVNYDSNIIVLQMNDSQGKGQGTATLDRKLGILTLFNGVFKDPQGNPIKMSLELKSTVINSQTSNYTAPTSNSTTSTASEASSSNIVTTSPGFEFFFIIPTFAILLIIRKRR